LELNNLLYGSVRSNRPKDGIDSRGYMSKIVVTIDGGGTKTAVMIKDGDKVTRKLFGGSNLYDRETFITSFRDLFRYIEDHYGRDCEIELYSANAGYYEFRDRGEEIVDLLKGLTDLKFSSIKLYGDGEILIKTLFSDGNGIVAIMGTGSVIMGGDSSGEIVKEGGNGYLIDDYCSGFTFGRLYLKGVLKGEISDSDLDVANTISKIYGSGSKQFISSYSKYFFENMDNGYIRESFEDQIELICGDIGKLIDNNSLESSKIYLHGSVAKHQPIIADAISKRFPNLEVLVNRIDVEELMMDCFVDCE
jgi:N-acetylglucosamine kinase-like BadF-type ATPase